MRKNNKIKYFAYCRKSTDDSTRQIASIDDQIRSVRAIVERDGLVLAREPFKEQKSSKAPGRPVFNEMLNRIENGEANGIICWDIDRLYRNPIDEGRLRWMLQNGLIQAIITPSRQFYPEDAGLLMGVEGGRATDYIIRLSKNVKRAFQGKIAKGWRPGSSPIGYINVGEVGNKTIIPDPERFEIVRKMWDLFLTGTYSVSKIRDIATNEWGLKTKMRRKLGDKPLSMSHIYSIFNDPFYYGHFLWINAETGEKELYKGSHQPMITESEFRRAQALLGKKGKARPKTREFAFTGIMRCGECNSMITAEEKNQIICSECKFKFAYENKSACPKCQTDISEMKNPTILNYTYYHCTKKKNKNCSQKTIRLEELEKQFNKNLETFTIDEGYLRIALDYLNEKQVLDVDNEGLITKSLQENYNNIQMRLTSLTREYTSPKNADYSIYTPEEFKRYKNDLNKERDAIEGQLENSKKRVDQTLELSERTFNFCTYAKHHFNCGDPQKKKIIFSSLGSNLILKDKKLSIDAFYPYLIIQKEVFDQKALYSELEPEKIGFNKEKEAVFAASIPNWLRR